MLKIKRFIFGEARANSYVIYGDDNIKDALIVDVGENPVKMLDFLEDEKLILKKVLFTHSHFDHVAGFKMLLDKYNDVEVYIHEKDFFGLFSSKDNLSYLVKRPFVEMDKDTEFSYNLISEGDSIDFLDSKIDVFFVPGHSPGSLAYKIDNMFFSGDVLFRNAIGRYDLFHSDYKVLSCSLKKLNKVIGDTLEIYPGHGLSTKIVDERTLNLEFIEALKYQ